MFTKLLALSSTDGFALDTQNNVYAIHLPQYVKNGNNSALIKKLQYLDKDISALNIIPLDKANGKLGIITNEDTPQILIVDPVKAIIVTPTPKSVAPQPTPQRTWEKITTFIQTNIWQPIKSIPNLFKWAWDTFKGLTIFGG